ncbi:MAG: SDR family oxidoreductase [Proteobacteria bacterium]|nr:SDR family oxidoreductase [Pseudomonadota bacterium]HQR04120.1 SDR family oxidoreductase [Rhodocyclaceae bacterium]
MDQRRVWITGASSGIGSALARHYAGQGATLALVARRADALQALARTLPGDHHCYALDVTDAAAIRQAASEFTTKSGLPDTVIANAGISAGTLTEEADDLAAFARIFAVNVQGMVNTFQPFVAPMRSRGSGRLAGIASVAGIRGLPGAGAYSASKAAVIAYLESLRVELHGSGVKVVTVAPGYIATPMTAVNRYPMPFLLAADTAAPRMARAIDRGTSYAVVPWQMGVAAKLLRLLPNALFDTIFFRAGRKPRGLDL